MDQSTSLAIGLGAVAILLLGLGGGFLPFWLAGGHKPSGSKPTWWQLVLNCLAGGVLFGAGVLHLLPDLVLAASMLGIQGVPTPYLFVAAGVLIPTAIEQSDLTECCGCRTASGGRGRSESRDGILGAAQRGGGGRKEGAGASAIVDEAGVAVGLESHSEQPSPAGSVQDGALSDGEPLGVTGKTPDMPSSPAGSPSRSAGHSHGRASDAALATPVLLAATLGVHSLLEGVGIGVQRELASSLGIVIAVVAHKGFAGFALGQLFQSSGATACAAAPGVVTFGLATPVGIVIGVVVNSVVASPWVDVVAVGLACGTFIFVSLVEILIPALEAQVDLRAGWRWFAFLVGVGGFAGIGYAMEGTEV